MKAKAVSMVLMAGGLGLAVWMAQDAPAQISSNLAGTAAIQTGTPGAPVPLSYGAEEIMKLSQAGVSPDTLRSFVEGSHLDYGLDAASIIYLREQGVPDPVIGAMLRKTKEMNDEAKEAAAQQEAADYTSGQTVYSPRPANAAQAIPEYGYPAYSGAVMPYDYYDYYDDYPFYYYPYSLGLSFGYYGSYHGWGYGGGGFSHGGNWGNRIQGGRFHGGGFHGGGHVGYYH
jgi:hypothetical protein